MSIQPQLADDPGAEIAFELFAIYEKAESYEQFCVMLALDHELPSSLELYEEVHRQYTEVWTAMGNEAFAEAVEAHR